MAQRNPLIKPAFQNDLLTEEEAQEWIKCANDCAYFLENYVRIQHPTKGSILFELRKYQRKILKSLLKNKQLISLQPRQSGKSTLIVGFLLWKAIFNPNYEIGVAANKLSAAKEIIGRITYSYTELPDFLKPGVVISNVYTIEFDNNSKIEGQATSGNTFRGRSLSLLYLDEFAFVEPRVADEFWSSIVPALSAGGLDAMNIIITSTPNGSEGKFAEIYYGSVQKQNGFANCFVKNSEVPGRDAKFKKEMLKIMSEAKYLQEFECHFISDKGTLIQSTKLEATKTSNENKTWCGVRFWDDLKGKTIALVCDVGAGIGQDYSVIQIFDIHTLTQVGEYRDNTSTYTHFAQKIIDTLTYIFKEGASDIYYTIEANQYGSGVIASIQNSEAPVLDHVEFISEPRKRHPGILTSQKTKLEGCMMFKDLFETGRLTIRSKELLTELKFFVKSGNSFRAETGMHDDLVMGCILLMNLLKIVAGYDDKVYDIIHGSGLASVIAAGHDGDADDRNNGPMPVIV